MNKPALKNFAISARLELLARVRDRAAFYGITEEKYREKAIMPTEGFQRLDGVMLSSREAQQRNDLLARIRGRGYEQVMEEAAYTWFNRFIALRYMEEHRLLPMDARVLPEQPGLLPQLVREAQRVELESIDRAEITAMLEENRTEELYKTLLIALCNQLSTPLPQMFEPIADYTELLFPDGILKAESVLGMLAALNRPDEDNWGDIQVIGWLYQYYNTELKQETFDLLKKNVKITKERIGAATQLFTPEWIVNYMVENSLGRLWLEGHPDHNIQDQWRYYLEEAQQEPEVEAKLAEIRRERARLQPEQITVLDPCMGSGHILVYAFDVLMTIYRAVGYTDRDAVQSIIENNLYGLDIDDRAAQLAYFALMMKACQYDRRFLRRGIQPHVCPIDPSKNIFAEDLACFGPLKQQALDLYHTFTDAKEYGSILTVPLTVEELRQLSDACDDLLQQAKTNISFEIAAMQKSCAQAIQALIPQAMILARKYDAVITNPPYMGGSGMNDKLARFVKEHFPDSKSDLFAVFMERGNEWVKENGYNCMVTMQSWMFLSSFEKMRINILNKKQIAALMHMENMVMHIAFGTAVTVLQNCHVQGFKGTYNQIKLQDIIGEAGDERPVSFPVPGNRFSQVSTDNFSKIPGAPVAYWVSKAFFNAFNNSILEQIATPKKGLDSADNDRFSRLWFEVVASRIGFNLTRTKALESSYKWFPINSGGDYRKWYGNFEKIVNWENNGAEMTAYPKAYIRSRERYFQQGLTWTKISSSKFGVRFTPPGFIFDSAGQMVFADESIILYLLGLMCSEFCFYMLQVINPTINYQVGDIAKIPVKIDLERKRTVVDITSKNIQLSRSDWNSFETSWDFQRHSLI